ncbi:TPA: helix-turn-helix transcriptional regulator [Streptococcus suis]|nr:helix-turn-helix transcriptional regulator [Streptococcus suis]
MNRLKELRKEKNLTQKELANKTGIPYRTIQRWENGESQIKQEKIYLLAEFFNVSEAYLLGFINDKMVNLIEYDLSDEELIEIGREKVRTLTSDKTLEQFENYFHKAYAIPTMNVETEEGATVEIDPSYIVYEKLTHIYWLIGVAPAEYERILIAWTLLSNEEQNKIIELLDVMISSKMK